MRHLAVSAIAATLLACTASHLAAQPAAADRATFAPAPDAHVRAVGREASRLLVRALELSPTVAQMVSALEETDLIVVIETRPLPKLVHALVQVQAATPTRRYLRLSLGVPNAEGDLLALLGHELRHCLEIASLPEVRDGGSLARVYEQIGHPVKKAGYFETPAALAAGDQVAREIADTLGRR